MRVYIAGPMTGIDDYNFPAFHAAAQQWRDMGWEVLNPAESFDDNTELPYKEYVAHDMTLLRSCDAIAMLPGWDGPNARGSVWEREIAMSLGLTVYDADHPVPPPSVLAERVKASNPKDIVGSNKLPLHLWPTTATAVGCLPMLEGALKYGRSNFRAIGVRASIYYDAARRHLDAWFEGEDDAPDSGIPHLGHALACLAIIVDAKAAGKLNDDRMATGGYHALLVEVTPHVARLKALHSDKSPRHWTIADDIE